MLTLGYCYEYMGDVAGAWHQSVLKLLMHASGHGFGVREVPVETGPFLSKARNQILRRSQEHGDDYVLFSDTDTIFAPSDVDLLVEADAAIAGALYFAAASDQPPWATALVEGDDGLESITLPEPPPFPEFPENASPEDYANALIEYRVWEDENLAPRPVAAVGCGLMLVRADVRDAMLEAYDHPFEYVGDVGEDVIFCQRAAELGHQTILVPRARIGHIKRQAI